MPYENRRREFDPTNRGKLEKELEKKGEHPRDYKGSINIDGREYWLSGYIKRSEYGTFLSLKAKPKAEERRETYNREREEDRRPPLDDEISF